MSRTGRQYIESLRDGRAVYVNGERVKDVTEHSAFRGAVHSIAGLYDLASSPQTRDAITYPSPRTGEPVNVAFLQPRDRADLARRRRGLQAWAESTYGLMGRSPDHVAGFLVGFSLRPDLFARGGARYAEHVVRYYEHVRDNDLYVSYVLIPPQIDRSKAAHQQADPTLYAGVVEEKTTASWSAAPRSSARARPSPTRCSSRRSPPCGRATRTTRCRSPCPSPRQASG